MPPSGIGGGPAAVGLARAGDHGLRDRDVVDPPIPAGVDQIAGEVEAELDVASAQLPRDAV
jgi:hypothetical protein